MCVALPYDGKEEEKWACGKGIRGKNEVHIRTQIYTHTIPHERTYSFTVEVRS